MDGGGMGGCEWGGQNGVYSLTGQSQKSEQSDELLSGYTARAVRVQRVKEAARVEQFWGGGGGWGAGGLVWPHFCVELGGG